MAEWAECAEVELCIKRTRTGFRCLLGNLSCSLLTGDENLNFFVAIGAGRGEW